MATIVATKVGGSGVVAVTQTTLTGTDDTFVFESNIGQKLILTNPTAGVLTPVIDGDESTSVNVAGVGSVDVSGGFSVGSIGVAEIVSINTDSIKEYLKGTIDITGGTGLLAILSEEK